MSAYATNPFAYDPNVNFNQPPITMSQISTLPVTLYLPNILQAVKTHRVTILNSATGTGKSTLVPPMLANNLDGKVITCLPKRLACKSLMNTLSSQNKAQNTNLTFGLRLGHNYRLGSSRPSVLITTTAYLLRLLCNHPQYFDDVSSVIVDEVHERGVDCDLICTFLRRLLQHNKRIRVVLMSATMDKESYEKYFTTEFSNAKTIEVKGRQYPVKLYYAEDLYKDVPTSDMRTLQDETQAKGRNSLSMKVKKCQYSACLAIVERFCTLTSAVLIFVSGMNDILTLTELIEDLTGGEITCIPVHGDIPIDDLMDAFETGLGKKVIISTNAAESSVTFPDVDVVVDLGCRKSVVYDAQRHRKMLMEEWVSQSTIDQRKGRTGRVRPGRCFRLWSQHREVLTNEIGEIGRMPLDDVVLTLKEIVGGEVLPVLTECIEPPDTVHVDKSFSELHKFGLLNSSDDSSELTRLGEFVSRMGLDVDLGRFIGLSVQFGTIREAIYFAAAMAGSRTPFAMANPLVQTDPDQYNDIMSRSFFGKSNVDFGHWSEPGQVVALMLLFESKVGFKTREEAEMEQESDDDEEDDNSEGAGEGEKKMKIGKFCRLHGCSAGRIIPLCGMRRSIRDRVARFLRVEPSVLDVESGKEKLDTSKLNVLQVILVWVFTDRLMKADFKREIECKAQLANAVKNPGEFCVPLQGVGGTVKEEMLKKILPEGLPFEIRSNNHVQYNAYCEFTSVVDNLANSSVALLREKGFGCIVIFYDYEIFSDYEEESGDEWEDYEVEKESTVDVQRFQKAVVMSSGVDDAEAEEFAWRRSFTPTESKRLDDNTLVDSWEGLEPGRFGRLKKVLKKYAANSTHSGGEGATLGFSSCQISVNLYSSLNEVSVSQDEIEASLLHEAVKSWGRQEISAKQTCVFFAKEGEYEDASIGARMLGQLAKGRRKENCIKVIDRGGTCEEAKQPKEVKIVLDLPVRSFKFTDSFEPSFLSENSVVGSYLSRAHEGFNDDEIWVVAANRLDMSGGGSKAENLTMLPSRQFVKKALACFGIRPVGGVLDEEVVQQCLEFSEDCVHLKEELVCEPRLVQRLFKIMDIEPFGLEDYPALVVVEDVDEEEEVIVLATDWN
ncbi:hypothetical protein TrVE_jg2583 [Triparma verrucosa]|uniref:Uncharacterized protein n=1 Tax=Triparma verrucosa TaxID=1606542 RepID=A0A9W7FJC7_9STRA|nr:hypothetical protein TrVE_jg2583 [Triparma verrucosa]